MNFISALIYLFKRLHFLFIISLVVGVITFFVVSLIPKTFKTETRLMMMSSESSAGGIPGLSAISGGMDLLGAGADGVDPLMMECLNAREIRHKMIPLFGFDTLNSESKPRDLIVKSINRDLEIYVDEESFVISVAYTGEDRKQNIEIVEFVVQEATSKYKVLQLERVTETTRFLQDKIVVLNDSLEKLTESLIESSQRNHIIDVDEQIKATALYLSTFEQKLFELKLKKEVTALEYGSNSINVKNIKSQIKSLSTELYRLKKGKSKAFTFWIDPKKSVSSKVEMSTIELEMGLISQLLKMAQVELLTTEAELRKKNSVVQIIQNAYFPDQKVAPKRIIWVLLAMMMTFAITSIRYLLVGINKKEIEIDEETRSVLSQLYILK